MKKTTSLLRNILNLPHHYFKIFGYIIFCHSHPKLVILSDFSSLHVTLDKESFCLSEEMSFFISFIFETWHLPRRERKAMFLQRVGNTFAKAVM